MRTVQNENVLSALTTRLPTLLILCLVFGLAASPCRSQESARSTPLDGAWTLLPDQSTAVDPWKSLSIEIEATRSRLRLRRVWRGNYGFAAVDSVAVPIDGEFHQVPLTQWSENRHIGVFVGPDSTKKVSATWLDEDQTLRVETLLPARTSQGTTPLRTYAEYRVGPRGVLTVLELRSTRPRPIRYTFRRTSTSQ
jgi:hypothetical protein